MKIKAVGQNSRCIDGKYMFSVYVRKWWIWCDIGYYVWAKDAEHACHTAYKRLQNDHAEVEFDEP